MNTFEEIRRAYAEKILARVKFDTSLLEANTRLAKDLDGWKFRVEIGGWPARHNRAIILYVCSATSDPFNRDMAFAIPENMEVVILVDKGGESDPYSDEDVNLILKYIENKLVNK